MKGCIAKDANGDYLLVPQRGKKVRLSTSGEIAAHLGQQVRLSGAFVDADDADADSARSGGGSSGPGKHHPVREFRVLKVDVISATCPAVPTKKK